MTIILLGQTIFRWVLTFINSTTLAENGKYMPNVRKIRCVGNATYRNSLGGGDLSRGNLGEQNVQVLYGLFVVFGNNILW